MKLIVTLLYVMKYKLIFRVLFWLFPFFLILTMYIINSRLTKNNIDFSNFKSDNQSYNGYFKDSNSIQTSLDINQTADTTESIIRKDIVEFAKMYLGKPYRYGSYNPEKGFDCSGFVYFVFKNFNINLPRSSIEYKFFGTSLESVDFKPGDVLVFYGHINNTQIGHVGIICEANGMKSKFIHSSSGRAHGVTISELGSNMYTHRFYKCIDVIQNKKKD